MGSTNNLMAAWSSDATLKWSEIGGDWQNTMPRGSKLAFPLLARTADATSTAFNKPDAVDHYLLYQRNTAVTGTSPTLDVTFQSSPDGGNNWFSHTGQTQQTAAGSIMTKITNPPAYWRINYDVAGTSPNFTTEVIVEPVHKKRGLNG